MHNTEAIFGTPARTAGWMRPMFLLVGAAVLGGFGSIPGAVVGGVLIGVIESMAGFYLPEGWKDVAPYIVLLLVLLLKPEGLFGLPVRKKV